VEYLSNHHGDFYSVEVPRKLNPWWWTSGDGKICITVRYGARVLEIVEGTQATKQQTQQHQQLAKHLHKELMKPNPQQRIYPQPPTPSQKLAIPSVPMTNVYEERDKDELVFHSRAQHPFKII
jgi:hypothetical protein